MIPTKGSPIVHYKQLWSGLYLYSLWICSFYSGGPLDGNRPHKVACIISIQGSPDENCPYNMACAICIRKSTNRSNTCIHCTLRELILVGNGGSPNGNHSITTLEETHVFFNMPNFLWRIFLNVYFDIYVNNNIQWTS